jgi:hypothetical protein|tara:strand:+ start:3024 stop:3251 length:228 start_codon:yes stop_codon:yes gene_type:complete
VTKPKNLPAISGAIGSVVIVISLAAVAQHQIGINSNDIDSLGEKYEEDHDVITRMEGDVKRTRDDVIRIREILEQ